MSTSRSCLQCDTEFEVTEPGTLEVWPSDLDDDEPPLPFCTTGCAGTYLTDLSVA